MNTIDRAYQDFCTERFPPISERDVLEVERRIHVRFPEDYRSYLLKYNGGYFNEPRIGPVVDVPTDRLTYINGIGASHPSAELATEEDLALFDDNDPAEVVPIGYTIMGGLILLITCPDAKENGQIVYKQAFGDSYYLADGIQEFFAMLKAVPPQD